MSCRDCQWTEVKYETDKKFENIIVGFPWKVTFCNIPGGTYNDGKPISNPDGCCSRYKNRLDLGDVFK